MHENQIRWTRKKTILFYALFQGPLFIFFAMAKFPKSKDLITKL